ncbi:16S rRNA (guanine(966)-N(2))-methyltransferase RsmD [Vibrio sp. FNV 38]|nr:16S rRNA (guanine(966)-N(2))-methyltransferase RsmD [Vibrio sp. FNV 38]
MVRRHQQNSSQKQASLGSIRIISGLWRGRKLPVHNAEGLRPTTDRVKETVFNWLAQDVPKAVCLDVFAGSGGLGFEAASRQAEKVTMLELNSKAFSQLNSNIQALKAENIDAIQTDALVYLKQPGTPHDVVFIDPPFHQGLVDECIELLESNGWLSDHAMIYLETEKALSISHIPATWHLHRDKQAGQVAFRLYERGA